MNCSRGRWLYGLAKALAILYVGINSGSAFRGTESIVTVHWPIGIDLDFVKVILVYLGEIGHLQNVKLEREAILMPVEDMSRIMTLDLSSVFSRVSAISSCV